MLKYFQLLLDQQHYFSRERKAGGLQRCALPYQDEIASAMTMMNTEVPLFIETENVPNELARGHFIVIGLVFVNKHV